MRLSRRLALTTVGDPNQQEVLFHPDIYPTVGLERLLATPKWVGAGVAISGTGTVTVLTVPDNEAWILHAMAVYKSGAGASFLINEILVQDTVLNGSVRLMYLSTPASDFTVPIYNLTPVSKNWEIAARIDSFSSGGSLSITALVSAESDFT